MADTNDWNRRTIEEFRANGGKVGDFWEGKPLLLLTTTGAKSGQQRTTPMMYLRDDNRLARIRVQTWRTSTHPDWYHNLIAHPEVTVEVGTETYEATATALNGEERDRNYARQAELYPQFGEYQENTTRKIPVIALERQKG